MACMSVSAVRLTLCAVALAGAACAASAADPPEPIRKLTGSSDETARGVMTQQGYALRNEKASWGRKYSAWWSDKARQCVQLMSLAGRIAQVEVKGESDCKPGAAAAAAAAASAAASAPFDPLPLVGQPRAAVEQRLGRAGFKALSTDMSQGEATSILWTDGRQCLGGRIVNDRYEQLDAVSPKLCYIK